MAGILQGGQDGINFDKTNNVLSDNLSKLEKSMQEGLENLDPSNMADLLSFQQQMSKLTMMYGLQSGVIKSIKDTSQGIIQKIN